MGHLNMNQQVEVIALSISAMGSLKLRKQDFVVSVCPGTDCYQEDTTPENVIQHGKYIAVAFDDLTQPIDGYIIMQPQHARDIIMAVEKSLKNDGTDRIIVHCAAGVSRSPGVAIALSLIFNLYPPACDLIHEHLAFNDHVLRTMLNEWRKLRVERTFLDAFGKPTLCKPPLF